MCAMELKIGNRWFENGAQFRYFGTSTPDTSTATSAQVKTQSRPTQHAYEGKHTR
jgi:hypothetical protein